MSVFTGRGRGKEDGFAIINRDILTLPLSILPGDARALYFFLRGDNWGNSFEFHSLSDIENRFRFGEGSNGLESKGVFLQTPTTPRWIQRQLVILRALGLVSVIGWVNERGSTSSYIHIHTHLDKDRSVDIAEMLYHEQKSWSHILHSVGELPVPVEDIKAVQTRRGGRPAK